MEMLGNRRLGVTQQQAWDALNDPETLKKCIPGCDKFELTGDNQYSVALAVKIGPVSAKFNGKVALSDIVAPDGYKLSFEGQGGVAGFAKGSSSVTLRPLDGAAEAAPAPGCELDYTVQAQVGGKIAQLGQRLIDGAAKSTADDFFKRFEAEMQSRYGPPPAAVSEPAEASAEKAGMMSGLMRKIGLGKKDDKDASAAPGDASS
ncbi:putative carbon monoxide dehydrogenase, subunit G [Variovorax paradoxus B4]|uniref:Putative carbon monoxide dehydrogenase, subunit G n=1 Tax=Variovorax paradoxus B4 TaxID=1246301 RepID=T1X797_VARPD|nr:carbon monoxide dehydrogenase subunit G [Variovorax paradoxus]AGU48802.1 putative carbon monoxide dehydrogenase, subunit G [Variovorax paradoxus B4]